MFSINRMGGLSACNTTKENYAQDSINAAEKFKKNTFIGIVLAVIIVILYIFYICRREHF